MHQLKDQRNSHFQLLLELSLVSGGCSTILRLCYLPRLLQHQLIEPSSVLSLSGAAFITVAVIATVGIIKRKRTIRAAVWRPEGQSNSTRSSSFDEDSSPAKRVVLGKDQSNK